MTQTDEKYNFYARQLGFENEKEMLEQLYEGHSIPEVAQVLKLSPGVVLKRLEVNGIPRRNRGGNVRISQVRYRLFHVDQRIIHFYGLLEAAQMVQVATSTLYKFRQWKHGKIAELGGTLIKKRG